MENEFHFEVYNFNAKMQNNLFHSQIMLQHLTFVEKKMLNLYVLH